MGSKGEGAVADFRKDIREQVTHEELDKVNKQGSGYPGVNVKQCEP